MIVQYSNAEGINKHKRTTRACCGLLVLRQKLFAMLIYLSEGQKRCGKFFFLLERLRHACKINFLTMKNFHFLLCSMTQHLAAFSISVIASLSFLARLPSEFLIKNLLTKVFAFKIIFPIKILTMDRTKGSHLVVFPLRKLSSDASTRVYIEFY